MDLPQLSYFVSVANTGGFNAAARLRHVSQSALSRQVALLEEEIGTPLFERSSKGVVLTAAGVALKDRAERMLGDIGRLRDEVLAEVDQPTGALGLGLSMSLARSLGSDLLNRYTSMFPKVHLHVIEGISDVLVSKIETGEIDIAVITEDAVTPRLCAQRTITDRIAIIGAPSRCIDLPAYVDATDVVDLPLIMPRHPSGSRAILERKLATVGRTVAPFLEVETISLMIDIAKAGGGYLVLPFCAVRRELAARELIARPIGGLICQWTIVWSAARPHPAAPRKMVELIVEMAAAMGREVPVGRQRPRRRHGDD